MNRYETILRELQSLRLERDVADARFLLRLVEIEGNEEAHEVIHKAGHASFARFLKHEGLVDPGRFESFKAGLDKINVEVALEIGSEATIVAGKLTNGSQKYIDEVRDWSAARHGTKPSNEAANRILHKVDPREERPATSGYRDELAKLRAENVELRAKLARAEKKIAKLEAELGKGPETRA